MGRSVWRAVPAGRGVGVLRRDVLWGRGLICVGPLGYTAGAGEPSAKDPKGDITGHKLTWPFRNVSIGVEGTNKRG
jgi:hypothetical protein